MGFERKKEQNPGDQALVRKTFPSQYFVPAPAPGSSRKTEGRPGVRAAPQERGPGSPVGLQRELRGLEGGTWVTERNTPSSGEAWSGCLAQRCPQPSSQGRPCCSPGPEQTVNILVHCGLHSTWGVLPPFGVPCGWSRGGSLDCSPQGHSGLSQPSVWLRELWAPVHPSGGAVVGDLDQAAAGGHGMLRPLPTLRAIPHCSQPAAPL